MAYSLRDATPSFVILPTGWVVRPTYDPPSKGYTAKFFGEKFDRSSLGGAGRPRNRRVFFYFHKTYSATTTNISLNSIMSDAYAIRKIVFSNKSNRTRLLSYTRSFRMCVRVMRLIDLLVISVTLLTFRKSKYDIYGACTHLTDFDRVFKLENNSADEQ